MANPTAKAMNNPAITGGYFKIPRAAFGARGTSRPFTLSSILVQGAVFSFGTGEKEGKQREFVSTYKRFKDKLGLSYTTTWRALKKAKTGGNVAVGAQSHYTYNKQNDDKGLFLRMQEQVLLSEFTLRATKTSGREVRKLTLSEAIVFSYLFTYCDNAKRKTKTITRSLQEIADDLNFCKKTVWSARKTLLRAGLIYIHKGDNGESTGRATTYSISARFMGGKKKAAEPAEREWTRGEIDNYYAERRHAAEDRAERNVARAMTDSIYANTSKQINALGVKIAFLEQISPLEAAALQGKLDELERQRAIRLQHLGFTEEDLKPRYRCRICNDTGYDTGGKACACLKNLLKGVVEL